MTKRKHRDRPVVVHLTTSHSASDVRIFERQCRALDETGLFDVYLVAAGAMPAGSGVQHIPLPAPPAGRATRLTSGLGRAIRAVERIDADLYHLHDPELMPLVSWLRLRGKTVVWDAHEDYEGRYDPPSGVSGYEGTATKVKRVAVGRGVSALRWVADHSASGVVVATDGIAKRYLPGHTTVVGNEARLEDFETANPQFGNNDVLFTGDPSEQHLLPEVIEAVHTFPSLRLVVARREMPADMQQRAVEALGPRFEFAGFLSRPALVSRINRAIVGMVTYRPLPAYMEPSVSPTKLFEFAAAGLPVVGSPLPSVSRILADSGGGVTASGFTTADIISAIGITTGDPARWERMSRSARAWAKEKDGWRVSEENLIQLYRRLLL